MADRETPALQDDPALQAAPTLPNNRSFPEKPTLRATLLRIVPSVPGAAMACARVVDGRRSTLLHTDERAGQVERAQLRRGDGPSIEAARIRRPVLADVLEIRTHWTDFARHARENRIGSFLVVPLLDGPRLAGTLSFYGLRAHDFDHGAEPMAESAGREIIAALRTARRDAGPRETAS